MDEDEYLEYLEKYGRSHSVKERFSHDYMMALGVYLLGEENPDSTATNDKIAVLFYAIDKGYDRLLLLDSDSMLVNFEQDMAT
jgi:hypothetical protein